MVIAKPGLDGHDRGAKIIARALRDAGMEVIYTGLHQTPEQIVETAIQEDADAVGVSILSGAHMTLVPRIVDGLRANGADDVLVVVGAVRAQPVDDPGYQRHVRARENRHANRVRILLDGCLDDLLRRLMEPRVDDLHACVPQGPRDDLRAAIMPVETGLRDNHSYRARHMGRIPRCA